MNLVMMNVQTEIIGDGVKSPMPFIRVDGVLYDYADFEDNVKPAWKKKMREIDEDTKTTIYYMNDKGVTIDRVDF